MKDDKRKERLAALLGLELPAEPTPEEIEAKNLVSREAEAVLAYVENPSGFRERECNNCGRVFAVNLGHVAFCSDHCRQVALESKGIRWDPTKKAEARWGGTVPLVVPAEAIDVAIDAARSAFAR